MKKVTRIWDLVIYPTRQGYDVKDVILGFQTEGGMREDTLINEMGEPKYTEEELMPLIREGNLYYKERGH